MLFNVVSEVSLKVSWWSQCCHSHTNVGYTSRKDGSRTPPNQQLGHLMLRILRGDFFCLVRAATGPWAEAASASVFHHISESALFGGPSSK